MRFGLRIPTIDELIATYKKIATARSLDPNYKRPTERSIETAAKNYKHCVYASGLSGDRPYTELVDPDMIRRIFTTLCERMKGVSAYSYVASLQTVTARWTILKYKDLGYKVESPLMPDFGNARRPPEYKMLSAEQKAKIQAWYTGLAKSEDRRLYLAASIVAQLAVRPNDVARLTAENFVQGDDGYTHLVYRPHKTMESSNRRVDWPIYPALWDLIRSAAGERLDEGKTLIKAARTVFDRLNHSMRIACGMEDWNKAVYELRKLCVDTVRREQGVDAAVAISGDRRETIDRYYSDPYKLAGVTPRAIMAM
jgi:integrase